MTRDMRRHDDGRRRREQRPNVAGLDSGSTPRQTAIAVALSETPWQRVVEFEWRMIW